MWLRARARKLRWDEARVIVPFEMDCTVRTFSNMAEKWTTSAQQSPLPGNRAYAHAQAPLPGNRAYAHAQADMWASLSKYVHTAFEKARKDGQP